MKTKLLIAVGVFSVHVCGAPAVLSQPTFPLKTAGEVLQNKRALEGRTYRIEGFATFEGPSRGYLYSNLSDLRRGSYKKAIFLQTDLAKFRNLRIRDGQYLIVTGYLAEKLHGPLGVYPAHIIVSEIEISGNKR